MLSLPAADRAPDHPPLAVHVVASVLDQTSVTSLPDTTLVGVAVSETVGAGGTTVTVTLSVAVVESFVHVKVNVASASSGPATSLPLVARGPDHQPLAVQRVASDDCQLSVTLSPSVTVEALAVNVTSTCGGPP